jgi:hypothetical protein
MADITGNVTSLPALSAGVPRQRPQHAAGAAQPQFLPHRADERRRGVSSKRGRVPEDKSRGIQFGQSSVSSPRVSHLLCRVLGQAGPGCSTSIRRRDRGLCVDLLSLSASALIRAVEHHRLPVRPRPLLLLSFASALRRSELVGLDAGPDARRPCRPRLDRVLRGGHPGPARPLENRPAGREPLDRGALMRPSRHVPGDRGQSLT